jgi:hypothetical protein
LYIIDSNKDFYDYVSHLYGIDKQIIFDRRGSIRINDENILQVATDLSYSNRNKFFLEENEFIILEVGAIQHLFKLSEIVFHEKSMSYSYEIEKVHTYKEYENLFGSPLSISECNVGHPYYFFRRKEKRIYEFPTFNEIKNEKDKLLKRYNKEQKIIKLPILAETKLTKFLDPIKVWSDIQNYISSLNNDKDIEIPMTNKEKAELHGFDKYSFRHPTKL